MASDTRTSWFPLFEFQEWTYQSTLILPTPTESDAEPGAAMTAKKWAKGTFTCGQAFNRPDGYTLDGLLSSGEGKGFKVSAKGALGSGNAPATFEATATGIEKYTMGAIYQMVGWVFPEEPIVNNGGRVVSVRGSVRSVRGHDASPGMDLSKMPLGTVGAFVIARAK